MANNPMENVPTTPSTGWESFEALLQESLAAKIRAKARKLARRHPFNPQDWEDLAQELLLKAVQVWRSLDATRGKQAALAFLETSLDRRASNLLRHHSARRRRPHAKVLSLQRREHGRRRSQAVELSDLVTLGEQQARIGVAPPTDQRRLEDTLDVRHVLSVLPEAVRAVLEALLSQTKAEVARKHHLRRTTLESRLRRLRPRFDGDPS